MKRAIFFDRDGTLNEEVGYISDPAQIRLLPGAAEAVRSTQAAGWLAIVVSNQAGVGRGLMTEAQVQAVNARFEALLAAGEARLDALYYCPHHPQGANEAYRVVCDCRKPAPGLLTRAAAKFSIDLSKSYVVGDKTTDVQLAQNAGAGGILVRTGFGADQLLEAQREGLTPLYVAGGVREAVEWIFAREQARLGG